MLSKVTYFHTASLRASAGIFGINLNLSVKQVKFSERVSWAWLPKLGIVNEKGVQKSNLRFFLKTSIYNFVAQN